MTFAEFLIIDLYLSPYISLRRFLLSDSWAPYLPLSPSIREIGMKSGTIYLRLSPFISFHLTYFYWTPWRLISVLSPLIFISLYLLSYDLFLLNSWSPYLHSSLLISSLHRDYIYRISGILISAYLPPSHFIWILFIGFLEILSPLISIWYSSI